MVSHVRFSNFALILAPDIEVVLVSYIIIVVIFVVNTLGWS